MNKLKILIFIFCVSIILPTSSKAQAPNLGTVANFGVFTATGAITNNGTTTIWGDVGADAGSFTGSPDVYGSLHIGDATALQASSDLNAAYATLFAMPCDSVIVTPFGNGLVLIPGKVYCLGSASSLSGDVILDGKGNSNSIFIIKIDGAFSTDNYSKVILRNKASICNVYWQIGGALNLGLHSIFRGNVLADGAISLLDSSAVEGRILTRAGAISFNNNVVIGCNSGGVSLSISSEINAHLNTTFNVFPNPFINDISFQPNSGYEFQNTNTEISFYNALGILVKKEKMLTNSTHISTQEFTSGMYFYKITASNKQIQTGYLVAVKN